MDKLIELICTKEYKHNDFRIYGFGIDDYRNRIVIYSDINSDEQKKFISDYIGDENIIEYKDKAYADENTTSASCGSSIGRSTNQLVCSIGYRAKFYNAGYLYEGFVTCGHEFANENTMINIYSANGSLGTLMTTKTQYSGSVDAAFVLLNTSSSISTLIGTTGNNPALRCKVMIGGR